MRCSKCGAENPDRAKFCVECAAPFAHRCPSCNAENPPNAKFCLECAQPLHAEAIAAAAKTPSEGQAADGERRHLTLLFCDLVNSTEIQPISTLKICAISPPAIKAPWQQRWHVLAVTSPSISATG